MVEQFGGMLGVVGDARQAGVEHVEQCADARQQEHRRQRHLHDVGNAVDRFGGLPKIARWYWHLMHRFH